MLILKQLIADRFGGNQSAMAKAIGRSPAQINQWLTGHRQIGDAGARTIELALNLPPGYFDIPMTYAKRGAALATVMEEPGEDWIINQVVTMMRETDAGGRMMVLGAARAALAGYTSGRK